MPVQNIQYQTKVWSCFPWLLSVLISISRQEKQISLHLLPFSPLIAKQLLQMERIIYHCFWMMPLIEAWITLKYTQHGGIYFVAKKYFSNHSVCKLSCLHTNACTLMLRQVDEDSRWWTSFLFFFRVFRLCAQTTPTYTSLMMSASVLCCDSLSLTLIQKNLYCTSSLLFFHSLVFLLLSSLFFLPCWSHSTVLGHSSCMSVQRIWTWIQTWPLPFLSKIDGNISSFWSEILFLKVHLHLTLKLISFFAQSCMCTTCWQSMCPMFLLQHKSATSLPHFFHPAFRPVLPTNKPIKSADSN